MAYPVAPTYDIDVAEYGYNVTPSDTFNAATFPCPFKMFIVGGAGTLRYVDLGGNTVNLASVLAGSQYWIAGKWIMATGTTATGIVALV